MAMNRRDFLKSLQAGVYAVALPLIPMVSEARYWEYTIHGVEVLEMESAFWPAIRGHAVLVDRPDIMVCWAVPDNGPEPLTIEGVVKGIRPMLEDHFRHKLEKEAA